MNQQDSAGLITLICLLPLFFMSLPALFFVLETISSRTLEQSRARLAQAPGRLFFVGLVNGVFFFVLVAILSSSGVPLFGFVGLFLLLALILSFVIGLGALAGVIGGRILELLERKASPGAHLLAGSLVLEALLI